MFLPEPAPGATKAADDFVGDDEHAVFTANALHLRPIGVGRDDDATSALQRLTNECGHVFRAQCKNFALDGTGGMNAVFLR